jgi:hypothetical protein
VTAQADPDKACEHPDFVAEIDVTRLTATEGGTVQAFTADVRVRCAACDEQFRWIGVPAGLSGARPTCSVDEAELHAPLRPASADPDFGLGIPGFAIHAVRP